MCLSNVGLFKPKKITSATLGLEAKIAPTKKIIGMMMMMMMMITITITINN